MIAPPEIVIEPYRWTNSGAVYGDKSGVQWLVQFRDDAGDLRLLRVCKSRPQARAVARQITKEIA